MNKQVIVLFALFAMVVCVLANEYGHYPEYKTEEKRFLQIPALKIKLGMDKLHIKLPNLGAIFQKHEEHQYYPQHY